MIDYAQNIQNYNLSIYDPVSPNDNSLFIPIYALEKLISKHLIGYSLNGLPLRTRSKVVKALICEALGYPIPRHLKKHSHDFLDKTLMFIRKKASMFKFGMKKLMPQDDMFFSKLMKMILFQMYVLYQEMFSHNLIVQEN